MTGERETHPMDGKNSASATRLYMVGASDTLSRYSCSFGVQFRFFLCAPSEEGRRREGGTGGGRGVFVFFAAGLRGTTHIYH